MSCKVNISSRGFVRLVRLVDKQQPEAGRLEAFLKAALDRAIAELMQEWGFGI